MYCSDWSARLSTACLVHVSLYAAEEGNIMFYMYLVITETGNDFEEEDEITQYQILKYVQSDDSRDLNNIHEKKIFPCIWAL